MEATSIVSAVEEPETKEQYEARRKAKFEERTQIDKEVTDKINKKRLEDMGEGHWSDKWYKGYHGPVGSSYIVK